ncbi:MAG: YcnI family protein [Mycobacterium sp.]
MSRTPQILRVLITACLPVCGAVALYLGAAVGTPPAWAHVHASSDNTVRGATAIVTFQVPNESDTGATTTALAVTLPDVGSAGTETMPGWTAKLDRDTASGSVRSVTWTAAPNGGIPVDQFALFRISVQLPDTDTVSFPATQTYSDGLIVKWDQPPGGEPEHPAPMLNLAAGPVSPHEQHPTAGTPANHGAAAGQSKSADDNTARVLGWAALVIGALAICLALVRRRA